MVVKMENLRRAGRGPTVARIAAAQNRRRPGTGTLHQTNTGSWPNLEEFAAIRTATARFHHARRAGRGTIGATSARAGVVVAGGVERGGGAGGGLPRSDFLATEAAGWTGDGRAGHGFGDERKHARHHADVSDGAAVRRMGASGPRLAEHQASFAGQPALRNGDSCLLARRSSSIIFRKIEMEQNPSAAGRLTGG
jgi:hypothetical protein